MKKRGLLRTDLINVKKGRKREEEEEVEETRVDPSKALPKQALAKVWTDKRLPLNVLLDVCFQGGSQVQVKP